MSKIEYTESQIKEIESNKYVEKCTTKQIRFTNEFKVELVTLGEKGLFYREIFDKLGFPEYVTKSNVPGITYTRYKNIKKTNGLIGLIGTKKGRPTKEKLDISKMSSEEKIVYLETENAYLKELHKTAYGHYP